MNVFGPCTITGALTEGLLKMAGEPLKNTRVVLVDTANAFVKMGSTNDSGKFVMSNLPVGSYKIKIDIVNASTANPKIVTLDSNNTSVSIDLTVNKSGTVTTGLSSTLAVARMSVYPNPFTNELTLQSTESCMFEVLDMKSVQYVKEMVLPQQSVQLSHLVPGIYILKLTSPEGETSIQKNRETINTTHQKCSIVIDYGAFFVLNE